MPKKIGEVLRTARLQAGLSLRDLARLTGMRTGDLSAIESGTRRADPAWSTVRAVARGLGLDMEALGRRFEVGEEGPLPPHSVKELAQQLEQLERARTEASRVVERIDEVAAALKPRQAPGKKAAAKAKKR